MQAVCTATTSAGAATPTRRTTSRRRRSPRRGSARRRFRDRAAGSAAPWLFGIARNVLLMSVRRRRLERSACERLAILERLDTEPAAAEPDESWLDGLEEAFAELPDGQRKAIGLRVGADLDYEAVAAALGTSPPSARLRVHRGLTTLRNRLGNGRETST